MIIDKEEYVYNLDAALVEKSETRKTNFMDRLLSNNYTEFKIISNFMGQNNRAPYLGIGFDTFDIEFKNRKYKIKLFKFEPRYPSSLSLKCKIFFAFYDSYDREFFEKVKSFIYRKKAMKKDPIILLIRNNYDLNI